MAEKNEVALFGGTVDLTDTETLRRQMTETADIGARGEGVSFMSFSGKRGLYKIGVDGRGLHENEPFLVAIPMFKIGWICWKGGKPLAKRMAGLREPMVAEPDMSEFGPFNTGQGEGWQRARSMYMRSLLTGEEIEYSTSSKSGVAVVADLHQQVRAAMSAGDGVWPIIEMGMEEFTAQNQKNFKPTIEVLKWLTRDDILRWKDDFDPMEFLDEPAKETPPAPPPIERRVRRAL
jgi:hypothetical protein